MEIATNSIVKNGSREMRGRTLGDYAIIRRIGGGLLLRFSRETNALGRKTRAFPNVVKIYEVVHVVDFSFLYNQS